MLCLPFGNSNYKVAQEICAINQWRLSWHPPLFFLLLSLACVCVCVVHMLSPEGDTMSQDREMRTKGSEEKSTWALCIGGITQWSIKMVSYYKQHYVCVLKVKCKKRQYESFEIHLGDTSKSSNVPRSVDKKTEDRPTSLTLNFLFF